MPIYNAPILKIDEAETRRYAGLNRAEKFNEESIVEACEEALLYLDVRGIWKVYDYDCENKIVMSDPHFKILGDSIQKHLAGCDKVICMAVTVGEKIEQEITTRFKQNHYFEAMLMDAAATVAVEHAADGMEKAIGLEVAKDSYKTRWRYSPGYGDWNLTQQKNFFNIVGAKEIGMSLSISMMLMPRKSITAIIGLEKISADKKILTEDKKSCENCDKTDCPARNE